jgi:hypothetical protein
VAGTQRWSAERNPQDRGAGPLPSFEMPSAEAIDADKTLKRPRVRAKSPKSPNATEEISVEDVLEVADLDSVSTQEIDADDILDVIPLRQRIYPNPRIIHIPEGDPAHGMPAIPRPPATPWELAASSARAASLAATPPRPRLPTRILTPVPPSYDDLAVAEGSPPVSRVATIAPVALDIEQPDAGSARRRAESTFSLDTFAGNRSKRRRVDVAIAVTVGAFVGIFLLGLTLRSVSAKPVVQVGPLRASSPAAHAANGAAERSRAPIAIARAATETTSTGLSSEMKAAPKTSSTPSVDVSSLPQAQVGSISLASSATGHRLFVDNSVYASGSAVVSCGRHFVRVGSRGRAMTVDVPCGTDVVVAP